MISALAELGAYSLNKKNISLVDKTNILVQSPFKSLQDSESKNIVILLNFKHINDKYNFTYQGLELREYRPENKSAYLYRRGSSNGVNFTPVAIVTDLLKKTYPNKIQRWFSSNQENVSPIIAGISKSFVGLSNEIESDLKGLSLNKKNNYMLTITMNGKYIGDFIEFRELLVDKSIEKYKEVANKNGNCALCGHESEVYGNAFPFTFYTLDKPGYIAGGFKKKEGWRNFPMCLDCVLLINEGKAYVEEKLEFRFAGLRYYLIPRIAIENFKTLDDLMRLINFRKDKKLSINEKTKYIVEDEKDILDFMNEDDNYFTLNLLFFEMPTKTKFIINLLLEDIYPSRIQALHDAKVKTDHLPIFLDNDIHFSFNLIKNMFRDFQKLISIKSFLEMVDKIFNGHAVERSKIIDRIMDQARKQFNNDYSTKKPTLSGLSLIHYLSNLNLLTLKGKEKEMSKENIITGGELSKHVEDFFDDYAPKKMFSTAVLKAIFLTGVLTRYLLNIQYADKGSTPFRRQLKGLRMKEDDIIGLLPKIQNKLEEYDKNYYSNLESIVSAYFVQAGSNWSLSLNEINFIFTLGMNLADSKDKDGFYYFKKSKDNLTEISAMEEE